jgi:alpha-tubulin suppressor-like RCC1 family protein
MNLLFIDSNIPGLETLVSACNETTKHIIYYPADTFDSLNEKIRNLGRRSYTNVAFIFVNDNSLLKTFVSHNTFISFDETGIKANNTTLFIQNLVISYKVKTIDFLACDLLKDDLWKNYFEFLKSIKKGLVVRSSNNLTGNLSQGGDWVLETTNEDVRTVYFNETIDYWNYLLDDYQCSLLTFDTFNVKIIQVASGLSHTILLTDEPSNNLYACGYNAQGQLGDETTVNRVDFVNVTNNLLGKKITFVACGENHTAILTDESANNLYMTGNNNYGQLGDGTIVNKSTFTKVITNIFNKKVLYVDCGLCHTAILTDEKYNNLYTCGYNWAGQLGDGTKIDRYIFTRIIINLNWKKIISVSCGESHTAVITDEANNNLYTCGWNDYGQLGDGTTEDSSTFKRIVTSISGKLIKLDCGLYHTVVLSDETSNNVYACGYNWAGQLGDGTKTDKYVLINISRHISGKKVTNVSCGDSHTVILTDESGNNLYACGGNTYGQLGNRSSINMVTFTNITRNIDAKNIIDVNCGIYHTSILTSDLMNNLYTCGYNNSGQLGDGTLINKSSFTNIITSDTNTNTNSQIETNPYYVARFTADTSKSIEVFYKTVTDSEPLLIPGTNTFANNDIAYYTYNPNNGLVTVYTKYPSEVYMSQHEPAPTTIGFTNFNFHSTNAIVTFPDEATQQANQLNLTKIISRQPYEMENVKVHNQLEPVCTTFSKHVSFDILVDSTATCSADVISLYFKYNTAENPTIIPSTNTCKHNIYYTYNSTTGIITIYTKVFYEFLIVQNTPINIDNGTIMIPTGYVEVLSPTILPIESIYHEKLVSKLFIGTNNVTFFPELSTPEIKICVKKPPSASVLTFYEIYKSVQIYATLEPAGTKFLSHASFEIRVPINKSVHLYYKTTSDIIPQLILPTNTILDDVYYAHNVLTGKIRLYVKDLAELFITDNQSCNPVNFVLETFNATLVMNETGHVLEKVPVPLDTDAIADIYVKTSDMRKIFVFQTDCDDITSINNVSDIKYFVKMTEWPDDLVINPCHAYVSANSISSLDKIGAIQDNKQLVKHDFIRHIAKDLFGSSLACDLFNNADELKYDLAEKGHTVAWTGIKNSLNDVSTTLLNQRTFAGAFGYEPYYGYYLTNRNTSNMNICRELLAQIGSVKPERFASLTDYAVDLSNGYFSIPFFNGDTISFKLTLHTHPEQHKIIRTSPSVAPRSYRIRIHMRDMVMNGPDHVDGANVIVNDAKPLNHLTTESYNDSYPKTYTFL